MHVVAVMELATPIEAEAAALAADRGTTAYEERLKLAAGLPAIVLTSADPARAAEMLTKVRARGHDAVGCAGAEVVASRAMIPMRRFELGPDEVMLPELPGERLPYGEMVALVRAMQSTHTETRSEVAVKQFDVGRAVVSGGLLLSKTVKREAKSVANQSDQVLYVFRANGETPWILREHATNYAGLGARLDPSSARNFATTLGLLRALAPGAHYDERLIRPGSANRHLRITSSGKGGVSVSSADGVDLLAHLIAKWAADRQAR